MQMNAINKSNIHVLDTFTQTHRQIAQHIVYYASKSWGFCQKTYIKIANETNTSLSSVNRVMRRLKQLGLASIKRQGRNPSQVTIAEELKSCFKKVFFGADTTKTQRTPTYLINKNKKPYGNGSSQSQQEKPRMKSRLPNEVIQQIIKNFNDEDAKSVEKALCHIEGSPAYKNSVIEATVVARDSLRARGRRIENIGGFLMNKHKQMQDNKYAKETNTQMVMGFDKKELERNARAGESYQDVANRLRGTQRQDGYESYSPWSGGHTSHCVPDRRQEEATSKMIKAMDSLECSDPGEGFFKKLIGKLKSNG